MRITKLFLFAMISSPVFAAPMIEKLDRAELNWTTMKIRFYGESSMTDGSFVDGEKTAIQEGLSYIFKELPSIRKKSFEVAKVDGDHEQAF